MRIKAVWGFVGNPVLLGAESSSVKAGQEFDDVDDEYAHVLIGKGLAVEAGTVVKPKEGKSVAPKENK